MKFLRGAENGDIKEVIIAIEENNVDINYTDSDNFNALMLASRYAHGNVVNYLLSQKIKMNVRSNK